MTDTIQDRLRDGADRFLKWAHKEQYCGPSVLSIPRHPANIDALLETAATHIDAQDAKIKALVEALGRLCFELGALEAFGEEVRHEIGNTNYTAIMTRYEAARAALAAAKETT